MIGKIQYGTVTLLMCWCELSRRPIRTADDTTYEFLEYTFDVLCTYNNSATSIVSLSPGDFTPNTNKSAPGRTDIALREYLAQPRRQLIVWYGDDQNPGNWQQPFLISPPDVQNDQGQESVQPSDANNGPVTDVLSIREHDGIKTWMVHVQFKTWVSCPDAKSPILAHRFRKTIDIDQDYFTTIITQGEVTFDVGRLWAANQSPDFYRSQFWAAPPGNFAREHINVEVADDNSTCRYTIIDRERPFNLGTNSPATRIEGYLTLDYQQGSLAEAAAQSFENNIAGLASLLELNGNPIHDITLGLNIIKNQGRDAYKAMKGILPKYFVAIKLRLWGSATSLRLDLFTLALGIATAKLGPIPDFVTGANTTQTTITFDVNGKYVELDLCYRWTDDILTRIAQRVLIVARNGGLNLANPVVAAANLAAATAAALNGIALNLGSNGATFYLPYLLEPESIPTTPTATLTTNPVGNRAPQGAFPMMNQPGFPDQWARGSGYLQKLIVQGLSGQCQNPPVVGVVDSNIATA